MPDSFFQSKTKKRKRTTDSRPLKPSKVGKKARPEKRAPKRDEELSDETHSDDAIDDLDLEHRPGDDEPVLEDEDDADETSAQKRLRLAKLYLEGLKENLG
jgi:ribosomal RNA-processing protein 9